MKVLFVYSARFVRSADGKVYYNGQFAYENWERYLKHFDELAVACRMSQVEEAPQGWDLSSGPRVTFVDTPDDHGNPLMQLWPQRARQIIREELDRCDAVIVRQSSLGWLAAQEAQRKGLPWAVEVVGDAWDAYWNYGTLLGKLYAPVAWWESRRWVGKAKYAKYVTNEYLQRKYPCPGKTLGATDVVIPVFPQALFEKKLSRWKDERLQPEDIKIGMIGYLFNRYKGLHIALRALRELRRQNIHCHLHVLGKGKHGQWYEEAGRLGVRDLLHLDGTLPSGDPVFQWLDGLDVYIQPSFQEGLPRGLMEAMSRGLPALGSTCGGIPELLPAECLHRPGDFKKLAAQLKKMVTDSSWRVEQAKHSFQEAQNYYVDVLKAKRDVYWADFAGDVRAGKRSSPAENGRSA